MAFPHQTQHQIMNHLDAPEPPTLASSIHDLLSGHGAVPISDLPRNLERVCTKKGFNFNLLIVGNWELGQRQLVETLFGVELKDRLDVDNEIIEGKSIVKVDPVTMTDGPVTLKLNILTTPNFGLRMNEEHSYRPIVNEVEQRLATYLEQDDALYRKRNMPDTRIHLCLYLLSPAGLALHPVDIKCISRLTGICNVVPVIARADFMTEDERAYRKVQIQSALHENEINTFTLPTGDDTDEEKWKSHLAKISSRQPFACMYNEAGYFNRFGDHNYNPNNENQTDTSVLREAIIAHMPELVENTHYEHYEKFRAKERVKERAGSRISYREDYEKQYGGLGQGGFGESLVTE